MANRRSEAERYVGFVLRNRGWALLAVTGVTVFKPRFVREGKVQEAER